MELKMTVCNASKFMHAHKYTTSYTSMWCGANILLIQLAVVHQPHSGGGRGGGLEGLEPPQLSKRRGRAPPINVPYDVISHIT